MKYCFLLIQLFLFMVCAQAQNPANELLIRWKSDKRVQTNALAQRSLVDALHIELLTFASEIEREAAFKVLSYNNLVLQLERNQTVLMRAEPNDTRFQEEQENLIRVGYDKAWDLTPGGRTADGQEIVVAILDAGFDVEHSDLRDNLWRNTAEVADGLDNDNNGYVDDVNGWDMINQRPNYPGDAHGTQVIGILGAKGNNGRGISGTNWDLKMMLFSISSVADIVEAYGYILEQRRRYNSSGGSEGALVVATNASFGIEGGTCTDFPVWGSMYDELGQVGILTAASTANQNWDVEQFGDMPTDCQSDFLVGVANLGTTDRLHTSSAFGRESVDLAAPGEGSYSTRPNSSYGSFASTSAAAPYVTGAMALLYATPCNRFLTIMEDNPAAAALMVRDAILSSTTPNASLEFRTSSGGVLNVAEAQRLLAESCSLQEEEGFRISRIFPNPATQTTRVETNAIVFSEGARVEIFDAYGRLVRVQAPVRVSFAPVTLEVNVAGLPAGWYSLRLEERDRVAISRLVVR